MVNLNSSLQGMSRRIVHARCMHALRRRCGPRGTSDARGTVGVGVAEPCEYDEQNAAMGLLLVVRHAHGEETLIVLDADQVVALLAP